MTVIARILVLLLILGASPAMAGTQSVTVDVGGTSIVAPAPGGFYEVSEVSAETRQRAEASTPPMNRLLAVYVSQDDFKRVSDGLPAKLERYMFLQVARQIEGMDVTGQVYQEIASEIKKNQPAITEKAKKTVDDLLNDMSGKLSDQTGVSTQLKLGEQLPLGSFLDGQDAFGFGSIVKYVVSMGGQQQEFLMVGANYFVHAKNKILFAYVFGRYDSKDDIEWARSIGAQWVEAILAAN